MILNNVDKRIHDGIDTNHVDCETVEFTCKNKKHKYYWINELRVVDLRLGNVIVDLPLRVE